MTATAGGGGEVGLKSKIQKKLSSGSNVQYEPYYLESNYRGDSGQVNTPQAVQYQMADQLAVSEEQSAVHVSAQGYLQEADGSGAVGCDKRQRSSAVPASRIAPVASYAIYNMKYTAELEENVVTVKGAIVFEVFGAGTTQLPLVSNSVGLIDVRVNKERPAAYHGMPEKLGMCRVFGIDLR